MWPAPTPDYSGRKRIEEKSPTPSGSVRWLRPIDLSHQGQRPGPCDSLRHWAESTRPPGNARLHHQTFLPQEEHGQGRNGQESNRDVSPPLLDRERSRRRFVCFEEECWPKPLGRPDRVVAFWPPCRNR